MNHLITALIWCVAQVTLVGLLAWGICLIARRFGPRCTLLVPGTALAAVLLLTLTAFLPWPRGWRYGPDWAVALSSSPSTSPPVRDQISTPLWTPDWSGHSGWASGESSRERRQRDDGDHPGRESAAAEIPRAAGKGHFAASFERPAIIALVVILASGVIVGSGRLTLGLIVARSYRRGSRPIADRELLELVDVIRAELGVTANVEMRESETLNTAATLGWRKPIVLLPFCWRAWGDDRLRAVLAHELAHVARRDFLACVLAQVSLTFHFYHPLVHWLVYRLRLEQELAADAQAARLTGGETAYLHTLAEMALEVTERRLGWPAHTFLPTQGTFMRRIEMLRDARIRSERTSERLWPGRLAVAALIAGVIVIAGLRGAGNPDLSLRAQEARGGKPGREGGAGAAGSSIRLTHIPNDAVVMAAVRPATLVKSPWATDLYQTLLRLKEQMIPQNQIEQIAIAILVKNDRVATIVIVEASESVDAAALAKLVAGEEPAVEYQAEKPVTGVVYTRLDAKAVAVGLGPVIAEYLAGKRGEPDFATSRAWSDIRERNVVAVADMRLIRTQPRFASAAQTMPQPFLPLVEETEIVAAGVSFDQQVHVRVVADCLGRRGADQVKEVVSAGAITTRNLLRARRSQANQTGSEPEIVRTLLDAADKALSNVGVDQQELLVSAEADVDLKGKNASAMGLLLPAMNKARASARRSQSMNNLKQIMLAMHIFADAHGHFPPPVLYGKDGKGKVPHSWRVALLPYLEQEALYRAYNFDEPWDSETNQKVLAQMPSIYRDPGDDPQSTSASYYVFVGPMDDEAPLATMFSRKAGTRFADVLDGLSNTIAVVEAKRSIPWTKPDDISWDPKGALPKLGGFHQDGFHAGIGDGSVRFISDSLPPDILKALVSAQGGEVIDLNQPVPQPKKSDR